MRRFLLLILAAALCVSCLVSCDDRFDVDDVSEPFAGSTETVGVAASKAKVIILSGQSNAAGVSYVSEIQSESAAKYAAGFDDILLNVNNSMSGHDTDGFVKTTTGWGDNHDGIWFGPEVGLAEQLTEEFPGEKFYIIKYAWSGAELESLFLPGKGAYKQLCKAVDDGLAALREQGLDPEVVAFCWMQGESDACKRGPAKRYDGNQMKMVKALRERYGGFFFLDAGISPSWPFYTRVNNAKVYADCVLEHCEYINSNYHGLVVSPNDIAHYDAPSMLKLGQLFGSRIAQHIEIIGE